MANSTTRRRGLKPRAESGLVPISEIWPSPENDQLYRPVDPDDPAIKELAASIRERGVLEPIVISADGYIVSGHRRYAAARLAGLRSIPARRLTISRDANIDGFVRLLREHNRQRIKTRAETLREVLVDTDSGAAHQSLIEYRRAKARVGVESMTIGDRVDRAEITKAKGPMLDAVAAIINERRQYWPLTARIIHYALLNDPPLKHASKPGSRYDNTPRSYKCLVDLLTRARLDRYIPMCAIDDETRPVEIWNTHADHSSFVRSEVESMFLGYYRDLMQSQPNHIEIIGEKNTVGPILREVAAEYCIPMTTGRGFCSLPPRSAMADRFEASGKDKLVLLIVSDFDPDGEQIAHSFARSMRDDFDIEDTHAIKVALTHEQVSEFDLKPNMFAKEKSTNYRKFVEKYGESVFELEAIEPEQLQEVLREHIESVIDRDAYGAEIENERQDAAQLSALRKSVVDAIKEMGIGNE